MRISRLGIRITGALCVLAVVGCASGSREAAAPTTPRGSSDHIVEAEFETVFQYSAYEAVQRLRPRWLTTRTGASPMVHVNGNVTMGGAETLRSIRAVDVQEMRYMNASDATTRFGTNYISGVILVTTKR